MPIYSKSARCFPNECYICKSRENLIRCECNTISYCSEDHRQQHFSTHENFCKVVKELLKEKGIAHIHEELIFLFDPEWTKKRDHIRKEIKKKLGRILSPLEKFMLDCPRICFDCHETKQENLIDCPHCPIASFCKEHENDESHEEYCKVMSTYLDILTKAEELNVDLGFLSSDFPFTGEKNQYAGNDYLSMAYRTVDTEIERMMSNLSKINLIDFINVASKINNALQKIHDTIPEELTIHIDAITKNNYWEFLLHLNPQIKKLKIVTTSSENQSNLKMSLCENCHSKKRELAVTCLKKSYEDYMLDGNYQEPDILFYIQISDECNSERLNKWSEFNFSVVLRFELDSNFCKILQFLSLSTTKFRFIYAGQLTTQFATLSSLENKDYFIILLSKESKVLSKSCVAVTGEICEEKNGANTIVIPLEINKSYTQVSKCSENNADLTKIIELESEVNCNKDKSDVEPNEHQSSNVSLDESNESVIEKENIKDVAESGKENKKGKKNKSSKTEICQNCLKSMDNETLDPNNEEGKNDNIDRNNLEERKENNILNFKNFNKNGKREVNFSQSYLIKHISYLKNENEGLRQQLNLSFNEVTKLQTKLEQVSLDLNKILSGIVNFGDTTIEDTDSVCEESKI
ncbi:uncharacterized protein LOC122508671 [Leptopilina heterotoma]|uniref:uncharacterized protein LOC122508671 n=1 Tax=Leptopilina heterotoma TaxID=63436 RepID=UPI001CA898F0|nr:uncharacterized protein LOC122508671 [Leptopilina heterotoma]